MQKIAKILAVLACSFITMSAIAQIQVTVQSTTTQKALGTITFTNSRYGLQIQPQLTGLSAGVHGMHLHEHPSCADHGNSAKGHFDPHQTGKHLGPYNEQGHLGDLPALAVDRNGSATLLVIAPRLLESELAGRAVIIHAGGDNYSDTPANGGGGARDACGIIKAATAPRSAPHRKL